MLDNRTLTKLATDELIRVFGRKYLQDNFVNTCTAYGYIGEDTYQFFVGIKGSQDLPDRVANDKGWVVYGLVLLDAESGEVISLEYELE